MLTDTITAGISRLVLAPDDLGPAVGRQLGFWGGDPAAADRAGRALTRVQGMLGPDAVVTAFDGGGRTPVERIRWVPWGEPRDQPEREPRPWPGAVPGPAPARVFDPPVAAELLDAEGAPDRGLRTRGAVGPTRGSALCRAARRRGAVGGIERPLGSRPALVGLPPPARAVAGGGRRRHRVPRGPRARPHRRRSRLRLTATPRLRHSGA